MERPTACHPICACLSRRHCRRSRKPAHGWHEPVRPCASCRRMKGRAMRLFQVAAAVLLFITGVGGVAKADELADVKARGKLVCGTLGTAEPFSFQDPKTREIVGYDIDICRKVAESLGVTLELKPMAVEARIPELLQGRVDILAANLGWSKERAQQIDYSYSYFVSEQKVLVSADSGISALEQLSGKRVSAI